MCAISAGQPRPPRAADRPRREGGQEDPDFGRRPVQLHQPAHRSRPLHLGKQAFLHIGASAATRQHDFIALVRRHGIAFHEKKLGQLFCDDSARDIVGMLLQRMRGGRRHLDARYHGQPDREGQPVPGRNQSGKLRSRKPGDRDRRPVDPEDGRHRVRLPGRLAVRRQRAADPRRPCPLHLRRRRSTELQGSRRRGVRRRGPLRRRSFSEAMLFTHRGLSGPAILQISSYWRDGMPVEIDMLPGPDVEAHLKRLVAERPKAEVKTLLSDLLPRRLAPEGHSSRIRRPSTPTGCRSGNGNR